MIDLIQHYPAVSALVAAAAQLVHAAVTAFFGSKWYKANTTIVQRAYLSVLDKSVEKKLDTLSYPASLPEPHMGIVGSVLHAASQDADAAKHPAIKAALAGNSTQLHGDVREVVKAKYVGRGMTAKGG